MFFKETIDNVYLTKHTLELALDRLSELEKQQNAIIECINHDRKDINCLIQMIKKIETKRKK